jgi:pyridoxal phosphate enzyme (YggS family)
VLKQFTWVHSVDSLSLAQRVARIAVEEALKPRVFLQVKLRPDPTKGGFEPEELLRVWPELQALEGLQLVGLMTMAPLELQLPERQRLFEDCAALAQQLQLGQLSMGMSGDWIEAAAAGSTWVRIGSALFGPKALSRPAWDAI